jgi:hypothetical protein
MGFDTVQFSSVEEARDYASTGGKYLVLDPETLQRIETAESAGGFEGGQTGNADGAPFSAPAEGGDNSSSDVDLTPAEELDLEGAWKLKKTMTIDNAVEHIMGLREVLETWVGDITGPVILVPEKELHRWMGIQDPNDGA